MKADPVPGRGCGGNARGLPWEGPDGRCGGEVPGQGGRGRDGRAVRRILSTCRGSTGLIRWRDAGGNRYLRALAIMLGAAILLAVPLFLPDKQVEVLADGKVFSVSTSARRVEQALAGAGIRLSARDVVVPEPGASLRPGMRVHVYRCVPLSITADGITRELSSPGPTVAAVLREAGVALGSHDEVIPGLEAAVQPGMAIRVVRITYGEATTREEIPHRVERRDDEGIPFGLARVLQRGKPGVQQVTYRVKYADGQEVAREPVGYQVVRQPVTEVVAVGRASSISRGGQVIRFRRAMEVTATAYYPGPESCGPNATGYTYTGMKAGRGIVAVDPRVIPLGTRLYVEGYGYGLAADIGGAIKGSKVDLCYDTLAEAWKWGKRRVIVYILP